MDLTHHVLILVNLLLSLLVKMGYRGRLRGDNGKRINQSRSITGLFLEWGGGGRVFSLTGCPLSVNIHPICPGEWSRPIRSLVFPGVQLCASPGHPGPLALLSWLCSGASVRVGEGMLFLSKCDFAMKYLLGVTFVYCFTCMRHFIWLVFTHVGEIISPTYHVN